MTSSADVESARVYPNVSVMMASTSYVASGIALTSGICKVHTPDVTDRLPSPCTYLTPFTTTERVCPLARVTLPVRLGVVSCVVNAFTVTGPAGRFDWTERR